MKLTTIVAIVVSFLISQTSASLFDEFRGAISSVEDSVGKLFSDVVTDVEETLGCTILAVKKVLSLGGDFHESSDYDARCGGRAKVAISSIKNSPNMFSPTPPLLPTPSRHGEQSDKFLSDRISAEVNDSVGKVKETMLDIIENHDTTTKIEQVKKRLKNTTEQLTKVSALLHNELDNVTEDVKKVLSRMEIDYIHPSIDNLWKDIKILHDVQLNETNTQDAAEISHILNDVLNVLSANNDKEGSLAIESDKYDSDKIFTLLQDQFEKMKEKRQKSYGNETKVLGLDPQNENITSEIRSNQERVPSVFPQTFQDVAKNIINETENELSLPDSNTLNTPKETETSLIETREAPVNIEKTTDDNVPLQDYYSFLVIPQDSDSRKAAASEAQELIEESKQTDAVMASFLQEANSKGTSVFDNPDLFIF